MEQNKDDRCRHYTKSQNFEMAQLVKCDLKNVLSTTHTKRQNYFLVQVVVLCTETYASLGFAFEIFSYS